MLCHRGSFDHDAPVLATDWKHQIDLGKRRPSKESRLNGWLTCRHDADRHPQQNISFSKCPIWEMQVAGRTVERARALAASALLLVQQGLLTEAVKAAALAKEQCQLKPLLYISEIAWDETPLRVPMRKKRSKMEFSREPNSPKNAARALIALLHIEIPIVDSRPSCRKPAKQWIGKRFCRMPFHSLKVSVWSIDFHDRRHFWMSYASCWGLFWVITLHFIVDVGAKKSAGQWQERGLSRNIAFPMWPCSFSFAAAQLLRETTGVSPQQRLWQCNFCSETFQMFRCKFCFRLWRVAVVGFRGMCIRAYWKVMLFQANSESHHNILPLLAWNPLALLQSASQLEPATASWGSGFFSELLVDGVGSLTSSFIFHASWRQSCWLRAQLTLQEGPNTLRLGTCCIFLEDPIHKIFRRIEDPHKIWRMILNIALKNTKSSK